MQGPLPTLPTPPEPGNRVGLGWAITWLVLVSLGCMSSLVLIFSPEALVNVSIITVPLFVSGWASVGAAAYARKKPMPAPVVAPLVGGIAGLIVGGVGLAVAYAVIWPAF